MELLQTACSLEVVNAPVGGLPHRMSRLNLYVLRIAIEKGAF